MRRFNGVFKELNEDDLRTIRKLLEWPDTEDAYTTPGQTGEAFLDEVVERTIARFGPLDKRLLVKGQGGLSYDILLRSACSVWDLPCSGDEECMPLEKRILDKGVAVIDKQLTPEQQQEITREILARSPSIKPTLTAGLPLAAILAGEAGGFATYMAASSLMATIASAVGVTLPFAAYTGVATMLSIFLGPIGWTVSGSVALFGVGNAIVKRRRQRLAGRFVSFVIFLIGLRRRKELATSERAAAVQAEIKTLEQQLDRLDETDIRKEAGRNIRRSLSDRRLVHARLKAQEREYREVALQPGREVPVKSGGNHTSIFGSKRVTCIADIPVEQVRKMFHKIVEHTGVTGIFLGAFDRDRGKPYPDPKLKLKMEKNKLTGSLLTKARRGNCCSIRIAVLESWEPEVLHHIRVEGYLLE